MPLFNVDISKNATANIPEPSGNLMKRSQGNEDNMWEINTNHI